MLRWRAECAICADARKFSIVPWGRTSKDACLREIGVVWHSLISEVISTRLTIVFNIALAVRAAFVTPFDVRLYMCVNVCDVRAFHPGVRYDTFQEI